ncbi:MAG: sigma-70 family RNA polymerase sigma factor [Candidatus Saccharimonadales bacterium]
MTKHAFTELYTRYVDKIYSYVYWRTSDAGVAEDITSEVFTKAWAARDTFDGTYPQAWLYTIARNLLTDYHRRLKPSVDSDVLAELVDTTHDTPQEAAEKTLTREKLARAISQLPEQAQSIIIWRFVDNESAAEIGKRLGISEGNVRIQQMRALKRMKEWYESQ